jgi:hypothetical protein
MTIGRVAQAATVPCGFRYRQQLMARVLTIRTKQEHWASPGRWPVTSDPRPIAEDDLETAIDLAIAACDGDVRATVRALIVANNFLESEVRELMKAVSHAYARGRFQSYSG